MNAELSELRRRVADLVQAASGGAVPVGDALADGASLVALGLDSLGMLRLIDALELEFDVAVDLHAGGDRLDTIDDIVRRLGHPATA